MNTRGASSTASSLLGQALAGLILAAPPAYAQTAVSTRVVPVAGTVSPALPGAADAAAESVRCSGEVKVTTRAVSDPSPPPATTPAVAETPLPPGVVVSIDAAGVSCAGQSTRAPYVAASQANLTRRLVATDVIETTFAVYRDVPGGLQQARTGLLTLTLSYDTTTGALTAATASVGSLK